MFVSFVATAVSFCMAATAVSFRMAATAVSFCMAATAPGGPEARRPDSLFVRVM